MWGYRTIHATLRRDESELLVVSEKVVRRIMREEGLRPLYLRKPKRWSSYKERGAVRGARQPREPGLPRRTAEHAVADGRAPVRHGRPQMLAVPGRVVSWTLSRSPDAAMADGMPLDAIATLGDGERPVIHSGRGCHYRWPGWIRIREENGLPRSMSAKGCSPDNAAMEGFLGRLKNEFLHCRDWRA